MWKILVAFIAFALVALFVIMKGGDKVDMQGEAGGHDQTSVSASAHGTPAATSEASTSASASNASPAASAEASASK